MEDLTTMRRSWRAIKPARCTKLQPLNLMKVRGFAEIFITVTLMRVLSNLKMVQLIMELLMTATLSPCQEAS